MTYVKIKYKIEKNHDIIQNYIKFFRSYKLSTKKILHFGAKPNELNIWKEYFPNIKYVSDKFENTTLENTIVIFENYNELFFDIILSHLPDVIYINSKENIILDNYDIYKNNITVLFRKQNIVYVNGISGLANNMFQIATAIHYVEKYGFKILLDYKSEKLKNGTSNMYQRNVQREGENYFDNIFSRFDVIDLNERFYSTQIKVISNNNECNMFIPTTEEEPCHYLIHGFSQNYILFLDELYKLENYFNFNDIKTKDYIYKKYFLENLDAYRVCVGVRIGKDFEHMKKLTVNSYIKAFTHLSKFFKNKKVIIYVLSDVKEGWEKMVNFPNVEIKLVAEDDITQMYVGLECEYFILSESTFHYWIALLAYHRNNNIKVVVFNDTDLTNRPLTLPQWIKINY